MTHKKNKRLPAITLLIAILILLSALPLGIGPVAAQSGAPAEGGKDAAPSTMVPKPAPALPARLPARAPQVPDTAVRNGDFELGPNGDWTEYSTTYGGQGSLIYKDNLPKGVVARSGQYVAWLGAANDEVSVLSQSVTVPNHAILTYHYQIVSEDLCGYDTATVLLGTSTIARHDLCADTTSHAWIRLEPDYYYGISAGETISLTFRVETDLSLGSSFIVDDVSLHSGPAGITFEPVGDALPGYAAESAIAVNPITNRAYVSNDDNGTVSVIEDGVTLTTVAVGEAPSGVGVNPVTNKIYVANYASANVSVIDGATNTVIKTLPTAQSPRQILVNPISNKVYVLHYSQTIGVIDGNSDIYTEIELGNGNQVLTYWNGVVNPQTNRIYLLGGGDGGWPFVQVYDGQQDVLLEGNLYPSSFVDVLSLDVNPTTNKIYVTDYNDKTVTVIDGSDHSKTTLDGFPGPSDIAVNPLTNHVFVLNRVKTPGPGDDDIYEGLVTVLDGADHSQLAEVPIGTNPRSVAVDQESGVAYALTNRRVYAVYRQGAGYGAEGIHVVLHGMSPFYGKPVIDSLNYRGHILLPDSEVSLAAMWDTRLFGRDGGSDCTTGKALTDSRQIAYDFFKEIRDSGVTEWQDASLGTSIQPLHRPDVPCVAYYEFPVVSGTATRSAAPGATNPAGFILVSTGGHDYPIAGWDTEDLPPTQALDDLAGSTPIDKYYYLDPIAYAGEDKDGNFVSNLAQLPEKIVGQTMDMLDQPHRMVRETLIEGTVTVTPPDLPAPAVTLEGFGSWDDLKQEYPQSHAVEHEARRRDAARDWDYFKSIAEDGIDIVVGETYILDLLPGSTPAVALSGEAASPAYVATELKTPAGGPPEYIITALSAEPDRGLPLYVTVAYADGTLQSHLFYVVPPGSGAPVIDNVTATNITLDSATITWSTDRPASSMVDYGYQPGSYPLSESVSGDTTNHAVTLTGLAPGTTYHYRIMSEDASTSSLSLGHSFTTASPDNIAPQISGLGSQNIGTDRATITWTTDEPADSLVRYGTQPGTYSGQVDSAGLVTSHSLALTGLASGTTYYYEAQSTDASSNTATSPEQSFTTRSEPSGGDHQIFVPLIVRRGRSAVAAAPNAPAMEAAEAVTPGATTVAGAPTVTADTAATQPQSDANQWSWAFYWASPDGTKSTARANQPLYDQIKPDTAPNTKACYSGCVPTAYTMLIGWADRQAATAQGPWRYRWGLYRQNGGRGVDAVAPLDEPQDNGIANVTWELHTHMGTTCKGIGGSTTSSTDGRTSRQLAQYFAGRSVPRFDFAFDYQWGFGNDEIVTPVRDSIEDERTPAVVHNHNHAQLALGVGLQPVRYKYCPVRSPLGFCKVRKVWRTGVGTVWLYTNTGWTYRMRYRWLRAKDIKAYGVLSPGPARQDP